MSSPVEDTINALTEFESLLDSAKNDAAESKKRMLKGAQEWAEAAKSAALARADKMASETIAKARTEAERDAAQIRSSGEAALRRYEQAMGKHTAEAAEHVAKRLLGESS